MNRLLLLTCFFALCCLSQALWAQEAPFAEPVKKYNCLFKNVNVISVEEGEVFENQDVLVKEGIITEIGPANTLNDAAAIEIDGKGQFLMPGLADMYVSIPKDSIERQRLMLQQLLAGVTYVRSMRGQANHITLRKAIQDGKYVGPIFIWPLNPLAKTWK